jgi:hypothetical protein
VNDLTKNQKLAIAGIELRIVALETVKALLLAQYEKSGVLINLIGSRLGYIHFLQLEEMVTSYKKVGRPRKVMVDETSSNLLPGV